MLAPTVCSFLSHPLFSRKSLRYWEGVLPSVYLNTLVKTR